MQNTVIVFNIGWDFGLDEVRAVMEKEGPTAIVVSGGFFKDRKKLIALIKRNGWKYRTIRVKDGRISYACILAIRKSPKSSPTKKPKEKSYAYPARSSPAESPLPVPAPIYDLPERIEERRLAGWVEAFI